MALLDGVIRTKFWCIPFIYGHESLTIEGTPLIDSSLAINSKDIPTYGKIELDKKCEIKSVEALTSNEYFALRGKIVKDSQELKFVNSDELK